MQKKLLALAVAGALVPAAAMAQSSVEIYGRANLSLDSWQATGATAGEAADFKRRMRVVDSGSRVGFRINEALGGGLRAFAVIETGVNIDRGDNNGQSGAANTSTGFWASRDSYIGLGGGWGDVRLGRQSIWWANGVIAQTGANYINSAVDGLINNPSITAIPVARQSNTLSYNSPTMGGFNFSLSYSPNAQETAGAGADADGRVLGITGRYTSGAIRAQADWATNEGNTPAVGAQTEVTGLKIGLGWAYAPGSQVSGIWGQLENDNVANVAGANVERTFWLVNWEHMMGQIHLLAQYYNSPEAEGPAGDIADSDVKGITLAARYLLSKRTAAYLSWTRVTNGDAAWADLNGGGFSSATGGALTAASAGADVKVIGVGVIHNF